MYHGGIFRGLLTNYMAVSLRALQLLGDWNKGSIWITYGQQSILGIGQAFVNSSEPF